LPSAGRELAIPLRDHAARPDTVVLGIVRGGVPVAAEVARALSLPLDVVLLRKLMAPYGPADVLAAAWVAGTLVVDPRVSAAAAAVPGGAAFLGEALPSFAERNTLCRGSRPVRLLQAKTILLVDNGARTGGTMRLAAAALRTLDPARIIAALPVASVDSRALLHAVADEVVCPTWIERLGNVGMAYADYAVPAVEQIHSFLPA
jgi:putative phosphoribosyl transferase